jgi:TolB protein
LLFSIAIAALAAGSVGAGLGAEEPSGRFVFISDVATPNLDRLFTVDAAGTNAARVTRGTQRRAEIDPDWSPGGKRIAFARSFPCAAPLGSCFAVWTVGGDGSSERRLTSRLPSVRKSPRPFSSFAPTWSPDGRRIAYTRFLDRSDHSDVYVMNSDGARNRRLTRMGDAEEPAWSPDGSEIAFAHGGDIVVLDVRTGNLRRLREPGTDESFPDWSPDGRKLAYERLDESGEYQVFVMNADGTDRHDLSPSQATDGHPVWSQSGNVIAFVSDRDGDPAIYTVDSDGNEQPLKVTSPSLSDYAIDWSSAPPR